MRPRPREDSSSQKRLRRYLPPLAETLALILFPDFSQNFVARTIMALSEICATAELKASSSSTSSWHKDFQHNKTRHPRTRHRVDTGCC